MKTIIKTVLSLLLLLGAVATAQAQAPTLSLKNITGVSATDWKYGTVACTSPRNITSITLSMVNNSIAGNSSGITPAGTFNSAGFDPRTVTYVFTGITSAQVQSFVEGITFRKTSEVAGANNYVRISVDANPTNLPTGALITAWEDHPDGSPHYYLWVNAGKYIEYSEAYNAAKSYYFQGMRGYLPTITSAEENALLENISEWSGGAEGSGARLGGWSAGARTTDAIADATSITSPSPSSTGLNFKWLCGPEAGFEYCRTSALITELGSEPLGSAYLGWPSIGISPVQDQPDGKGLGENCMQINYGGYWNDLLFLMSPPDSPVHTDILTGYFIEFGGSGEAYNVGAAHYPANPAYKKPTIITNSGPWVNFSPGNTSSAATTIKAAPLKSNVMVIE